MGKLGCRPSECSTNRLFRGFGIASQRSWLFRWASYIRLSRTVGGMITLLSTVVCILAFRLRSRASLELELVALRHQVTVLRRVSHRSQTSPI